MDAADRVLFTGLFLALVLFLGGLFAHNLPNWCAHPEIGGNHIVQPICPKE